MAHDPANLSEARDLADRDDVYPIGVFYKNEKASRYDQTTQMGLEKTRAEKLAAAGRAIERFSL
jgi:hypothetical protein